MRFFSIQRLTHLAIFISLMVYIIYIGRGILQPLAFAGLFMLISLPITRFYEKKLTPVLAILVTFLSIFIPLALLLVLMSNYLINVIQDLPSIGNGIVKGVEEVIITMSQKLGMSTTELKTQVEENSASLLTKPLNMVTNSISFSTGLVANIFLTTIYTFLLLLYRNSIKEFIMSQFSEDAKKTGREMLMEIRNITQDYLYGMLMVMLILGTLNSIGLMIIGIDYALFWGFLAALLAVVPYVGTIIGGSLPFLYAMATTGTMWQPIAVIVLFTIVQAIEGNLITPKIVGSSVELNPLAAILSIVIGNALWGVGGMILAIPFMAILRVFFVHIEPLRPLGLLLSSNLYEKEAVFSRKFDKSRFRLISLFYKRKSEEK